MAKQYTSVSLWHALTQTPLLPCWSTTCAHRLSKQPKSATQLRLATCADAAGSSGNSNQGDPPGDAPPRDGNNGGNEGGARRRQPARVAKGKSATQQHTSAGQQQHAVEAEDLADVQDQEPVQQQLLQQQPVQQQPQPPAEFTDVCDLEAAAAVASQINTHRMGGRIGAGWSGLVYGYKMPDGRSAAVKLTIPRTEQADTLQNEAAVLLVLQPVWRKWVPPLLAAGHDRDGVLAVLAVERVQDCRHLDPSNDLDVLPDLKDALAAVHGHGVAHRDIRCQNILVQRLADGGKKVWLIDWAFSTLDATQEEQEEDWETLLYLFGISSETS